MEDDGSGKGSFKYVSPLSDSEFFKEGVEHATAFLNGASRPFPDLVVEDGRLMGI